MRADWALMERGLRVLEQQVDPTRPRPRRTASTPGGGGGKMRLAHLRRRLLEAAACGVFLVAGWLASSQVEAFNIDTDSPLIKGLPDQRGAHFGYSVALFRDRATPYLLVGAPRAQTSQPDTVRPGAVYRCRVDRFETCEPLVLDSNGSGSFRLGDRRVQVEDKSNQFFGATLQAASGDAGAFVVCAPKYVHQPPNMTAAFRDPVGTCFLSRGAFSGIAEYSPCKVHGAWGYHNRGSCQAGFSAAVSKDGHLFVGAPGAHYWQGQLYANNFSLSHQRSTPLVNPDTEDDQYLGYALALGSFSGGAQQDVAVGVPRGAQLDGKVLLVDANRMQYLQNLTGEQAASYFGYALAVADVNGDQRDDLLVGAPLFFNQSKGSPLEHGRIYLYTQELGSGHRMRLVQRIDGPSPRARFGFALANCGDLNRDGFQDVAVGAPYGGPNGRGAVYIFNGRKEGLSPTPDQVILAESVAGGQAFESFGFSLSGGMDMDANQYPDLLVGDYKADKAVLLRARPVVSLSPTLTFQPEDLNLDEKKCKLPGNDTSVPCLTVVHCLSYTGLDVDNQLEFGLNISLDTGREPGAGRLFFLREGEPKHESLEQVRLTRAKQVCRNFKAYITRSIRDKLSPLNVDIEYTLAGQRLDATGSSLMNGGPMRPVRPVLNKALPNRISRMAYILKNCSGNGGKLCIPDLRLRMATNVSQYDMSSDEELVVDVSVQNAGDDAYETTFYLTMPHTVNFIKVNSSQQDYIMCSDSRPDQTGINMLKCDLGNPLARNKQLKFAVRTKPVVGNYTGSDLLFVASVNSTNQERDAAHLEDNHAELDIPVLVDVRLAVSGNSSPDWITYNATQQQVASVPRRTSPNRNVQHTYLIQNKGPLTIREIGVVILWPSHDADGDQLLRLSEEPQPSSINFTCRPRGMAPSGGGSTASDATTVDQQILDSHSNCGSNKCERIFCRLFDLERNKAVSVTIRSQLQEAALAKKRHSNHQIFSKLIAQIKELPYNFSLPYKAPAVAQASTQVVTSGAIGDYLPWWNILLAVLLGIFLLLLLVCFLRYMGFFARKRPPKAAEREPLTPSVWHDYNYSPGDTAL